MSSAIDGDRDSAIASSSAAWVRGVARLISSASKIWVKIGPGRNSNSAVRWLKIDVPVTSLGSKSGVHCTRLNEQPTLRDSARASIVLATPGTSSSKIWPPASQETNDNTSCFRFPTITFSTFPMIRLANSLTAATSAAALDGFFDQIVGPLGTAPEGFTGGATGGAVAAPTAKRAGRGLRGWVVWP